MFGYVINLFLIGLKKKYDSFFIFGDTVKPKHVWVSARLGIFEAYHTIKFLYN